MIKLDNNSLVIVTGAARGNGKAISKAIEESGAKVIRIDLMELEPNLENFIGDVTNLEFIREVVDFCSKQKYNTLSLVNNAGVTFPNDHPYPLDDWNKTIEVNLSAPFQLIEEFIPLFKRSLHGSIINITSLGSELAFPNNPAYMASKGGLKMLTKFYAKSLGKYGVRANNVAPGYIVTDMTSESYSNEQIKASREAHTFLGRWGLPSDIADVCLFLISNESRYITGQDIYVDGGWTANGLIE